MLRIDDFKQGTKILSFQTDEKTGAAINAAARFFRVSQSEVMRRAVSEYLEKAVRERIAEQYTRVQKIFTDENINAELQEATFEKLLTDHGGKKLEQADSALLRGLTLVAYEMLRRQEESRSRASDNAQSGK